MAAANGQKRERVLIVTILLPFLLIGIYGLVLTFRQKRTLEIEIGDALRRETSRMAAVIRGELESEEKMIFAALRSAATSRDVPVLLQKNIGQVIARFPLVSYPFMLDGSGEFIFPPAPGRESGRRLRLPPGIAATTVRRSAAMMRAEELEYEKRDVAAALKLYSGEEYAAPSAMRPYVREAISRCYFKLGLYPQAARCYRELAESLRDLPDLSDLYFLALRQQALCHKFNQDREAAYSTYLALYEAMLIGAGKDKTETYGFILREARDFLQTAADFSAEPSPAIPGTAVTVDPLARRFTDFTILIEGEMTPAPEGTGDRLRFEKLREIFTPRGEETLFYPFLKKYFTPSRFREEPEAIHHLETTFGSTPFVAAFLPIGAGEKVIIAGFCIDTGHVRKSVLPRHIQAIPGFKHFSFAVYDRYGNTIFAPSGTAGQPLPGAEAQLSVHFPGWRLGAVAGAGNAVAAAAGARLRANFLLLAGLVASLAVGLLFFFRKLAGERRLLEEKEGFVRAAAHNLKTPLTKIKLLAEKLELGWLRDKERDREYLEAIGAEASGMGETIDRMLEFSRLESAGKTAQPVEIDMPALIGEILQIFSKRFKLSGTTVETDIREPLPPLSGDRQALAAALTNLIDNALKYSPHDRYLKISARQENRSIIIEVADHGVGIPAGERDKVFDLFYRRGQPAAALPPGFGLGLYLVKQTVSAHGGRIAVSGGPGKGSVFRIELPIREHEQKDTDNRG